MIPGSALTSNKAHQTSNTTSIQDKCNDNGTNYELLIISLAYGKVKRTAPNFYSTKSPTPVRNTRRWELTFPTLVWTNNGYYNSG
jgi:hypothetical protein